MMPPVVEGEDTMYPDQEYENRRSTLSDAARRYKWYIGGATLLLVIVLSVSIGVSKNKGGSSGSPLSSVNAVNGTAAAPDRKKADLLGRIKSSYTVLGLPSTHNAMFDDPESPQARALNWVAASANYDEYDDAQRLQRYSLAAFFYATYAVRNAYVTQQVPWTTAEKWLSQDHECDWEGVTCTGNSVDISGKSASGNRAVTSISLQEHRISGEIPLDLVLLRQSLTTLVLSNNLIFMEGDALDIFSYLENLETLEMADNYIVERNGLPDSLKNLPNLKKIILSYNLLQGAMNPTYFANLAQLTHLEVESNYLSGPLPQSLYDQEPLVYLYLRRNELDFDFHHAMNNANWPNLFSLWLDHNNITGDLATELGKLTGLASFSVTNATLQGTIPSEIGLLTGLRRLWLYGNYLTGEIPSELGELSILEVVELYGNELTGTMPQGTCESVAAASYEYKVLSADCNAVQCNNCCTQCY